jgi:hypothetical protein
VLRIVFTKHGLASGDAASSGLAGMKTKRRRKGYLLWLPVLAAAASSATPARAAEGTPNVRLRQLQFPDGTGTIGLAAGWQTNAATAIRGVTLAGPGGARVLLGNTLSILMPNNPAARTAGRQLVAHPTMPADAVTVLGPQLSRASVMQGGPEMAFDNVVQRSALRAWMPRDNAAMVSYGVTETTRLGGRKHFRAVARIETGPSRTPGWWIMQITEARAPDATFDRDLPIMQAMMASLRIDGPAASAKIRANVQKQDKGFAARRSQILGKRDANERRRQQILDNNQRNTDTRANVERQSSSYQRNNDDAVEVLRGTREIEDTRTGERATVNLGYSDEIVDGLNRTDPDRYRQIRLRDQ